VVAEAAQAKYVVRAKIERGTQVERELERLRVRHEAKVLFQQELDAEQTPTLERATLAEYRKNPQQAPKDLIDGVMKESGLTLLLGPSGAGKSTMALQMGHSLMTGTDWLGQSVAQMSGSLGIVSYDMDSSMLFDWLDGAPGVDEDKVDIVNAHGRGNPLGVPPLREAIIQEWKTRQVEVVIIDSFSASFFGNDQNDAAATMAHYRDLKLFALTEVGAKSLIVITHSTEASPLRVRGSTAHQDIADSIVAVTSNAAGERTVQVTKYREAKGQHKMSPVVVTAPDDVTHLVDLDLGAMALAGMKIPAGMVGSAAFPDLPDTHEEPETDTDSDEEDDDL
jgi:archaellum biogenesis ATPase FlaH